MTRHFKKLTAFLLALSFVFAISGTIVPKKIHAQPAPQEKLGKCVWAKPESKVQQTRENITKDSCVALAKQDGATAAWFPNGENRAENASAASDDPGWWIEKVIKPSIGMVSGIVLGFVSLLTGLAGIILNGVIYHTIVNVKANYDKIEGINVAWKTIRDIGNMGFIFVLLYAAIRTILGIGKETQNLIVKIVVVAILINFSLFFTKVVIDISNVLALTFYEAIVPGAAATGFSISETGLSHAFTQYLKLTSLFGSTAELNLSVGGVITMGIMGSLLLLISAFVFFAVAIMFIIRFVVLIIVLILSPIAFLSFVLPEMKKYRDQWWGALSGQAFFAPIYFALTWISLKVLDGIMNGEKAVFGPAADFSAIGNLGATAGSSMINNTSAGVVATFINFAVVIALIIISLIIAKEWSGKAGPGVGKLTSWATGVAGGATLGVAGRFGRNTFGRVGTAIGDSEKLKERASQGGFGGAAARLALATGRKTGGAGFDLRSSFMGGQLDAGKGQKGGFTQVLKDKREKEKKFAESLGPSDMLIAEAERRKERATRGTEEWKEAAREVERLKGVDDKEALKRIKNDNLNANNDQGLTKEQAQDMLDADKALPTEARRYAKKGLKDFRKEQLVEAIEKSPTYKVATTVQPITDKTPKWLRWTGTRAIPNLIKAKNRAAIAEIRKDKKPVKDQLEAILRDAGDLPPEDAGGAAGGGAPPPAAGDGGPAPAPAPAP